MTTSTQPLRVLMVTPRFFPEMGGIESHVYEVSRRLVKLGLEVTVLTTDRGGESPASEVVEGIHVRRVPAFPKNKDYYYAPTMPKIIREEGQWDIIHCQGFHTLVPLLAMRAARHKAIPYILTFHSGGHSVSYRNMIRTLQAKALSGLLRNANGLIGVSRFEAELFAQRLNLPVERITVILNGSNLPAVDPTAEIPDETLILSVGRLEKYKGHHRIIEAFPEVLANYPNARLRVMGVGPYEANLKKLVEQLDMTNYIQIGAIAIEDRQKMATVVSQAKLVTLLSDYEANPVSVMEAISLRRPVLVTDSSGFRELAERGWVQAIPLNSTTAQIAQAVLAQIRQPAIPPAINLPTWDDCAVQVLAVYQTVLNQSH